MGGLERILMRITPIFMLICFICLGITHTFQADYNQQITYMSEVYYDKTNFHPIDNPTQEQKETALKVYEFDTQSYIDNIDIDILKRATTKTIQFETYIETLESFNTIWDNGYQTGDVLDTILNAVILIINTVLLPINIILVPLRIIAGIFLTAFSLVGININRETAIIIMLNFIIDRLAIPLISTVGNEETAQKLEGSFWVLNPPEEKAGNFTFNFQATLNNNYSMTYFDKMIIAKDHIIFRTPQGEQIYIYQDGQWIYGNWSRYVYITNNEFSGTKASQISAFLRRSGAIELEESPYPTPTTNLDNTTWTFNNQITFNSNYYDNYTVTFNDGTYTWETIVLDTIQPNNNNAMLYRRTNQTPYEIVACQELQNTTIWYSQYNLKTITITDTSYLTATQINNLYAFLTTNAVQVV